MSSTPWKARISSCSVVYTSDATRACGGADGGGSGHDHRRAPVPLEATSLAGLADALIKARVARNWTQRQLAARLGAAEQQVQRYESTSYRTASLARLCDIADALGVTFTERAELQDPAGVA